MGEDSVVPLPKPETSIPDDPLLPVLREGAKRMLMQAIETEARTFLAAHAELTDGHGLPAEH